MCTHNETQVTGAEGGGSEGEVQTSKEERIAGSVEVDHDSVAHDEL